MEHHTYRPLFERDSQITTHCKGNNTTYYFTLRGITLLSSLKETRFWATHGAREITQHIVYITGNCVVVSLEKLISLLQFYLLLVFSSKIRPVRLLVSLTFESEILAISESEISDTKLETLKKET